MDIRQVETTKSYIARQERIRENVIVFHPNKSGTGIHAFDDQTKRLIGTITHEWVYLSYEDEESTPESVIAMLKTLNSVGGKNG